MTQQNEYEVKLGEFYQLKSFAAQPYETHKEEELPLNVEERIDQYLEAGVIDTEQRGDTTLYHITQRGRRLLEQGTDTKYTELREELLEEDDLLGGEFDPLKGVENQ